MVADVRRNCQVYMIYMGLAGLAPYALIAVLYYAQLLGSYTLAMSVFAVVMISSSALEIPMGVVSDYIGRRKTMIAASIGYVLMLLTYVAAAYVAAEWVLVILLIGAFVQGLTIALASGTYEALLFESVEAIDQKCDYKKYFGRGGSIHQFAQAMSALVGGFVAYHFSYVHCYMVSLLPALILFVLSFYWVEPKCEHKDENDNVFNHVRYAIRMFKKSKELRYIAIAAIIKNALGGAIHRFEMTYFQMLVPEYMLGVVRMLKQLCGAFSFWFAHKVMNRFGIVNILIGATLGGGLIRLVSLLANNFFAPFIASFYNLSFGMVETGSSDLLQKEFSSKQRATMGSLVGMCSSLLITIMALALGWMADAFSVRTALFCFLSFEAIVCLLYARVRGL